MPHNLDKLQQKAARIWGIGYANGVPLKKIRSVILSEFAKIGAPPPRDVLAFAVPGFSDKHVVDWESGLDTSTDWFAKLDRVN